MSNQYRSQGLLRQKASGKSLSVLLHLALASLPVPAAWQYAFRGSRRRNHTSSVQREESRPQAVDPDLAALAKLLVSLVENRQSIMRKLKVTGFDGANLPAA